MERILKYLDYIGTRVEAVEEGRLPKEYLCVLAEAVKDLIAKIFHYMQSEAFPKENQAYRIMEETVSRLALISNGEFGKVEIVFIKNRLSKPSIREVFDGDACFEQNIAAQCDSLQVHRHICNYIFKELKDVQSRGNRFWVKIDHDDSWMQDESGEPGEFEPGDYMRLAVLSESTMTYDNNIFSRLSVLENEADRREVQESYRPFFMEYYIDVTALDGRQRDFIGRMIREAEAAEEAERNGEEENGSRGWYSAYFAGEDETAGEGGILFQGVSAFSASPVECKGNKIVIETAGLDPEIAAKIKDSYQIPAQRTPDAEIEKEIADVLCGVAFRGARIYKVGNGNCIWLYDQPEDGKKGLLYDVGMDNHIALRKQNPDYQRAFDEISRIKPTCVVLSHWDADHYKACVYCGRELFECTWIAPHCMDVSPNAQRLAKFLYLAGKLKLVDRSKDREIRVSLDKNSTLHLYVGGKNRSCFHNGKKLPKERLTAANCEGIAIEYENGITTTLMQGDVPYQCLPNQAGFTSKNPYDNLVVPHHGSKMDLTLLTSNNAGSGNAVICCTKGKNRPVQAHEAALQNCYANVEVTENADCYVELDFMEKGSMKFK